jgi:GT2 family glycosyltransferase
LLGIARNEADIYGSLAVSGDAPAWATTLMDDGGRTARYSSDVPDHARVESLPFLGFLIHRTLVGKIGLPDPGFFIAADDVEYCLRARRAGAEIIIAGRSQIEHPRSVVKTIKILGRTIRYLQLPPWKRYYDTRNRLLVARKYHGLQLFSRTLPGIFVRLAASCAHEPRKLQQLWAAFAGLVDGLVGRSGRRHENWGIRQ